MNLSFNIRNRTDLSFLVIIILIVILVVGAFYYFTNNLFNMSSILIAACFSLITVGIAYDTYKLNRANHKLALFDKRYEIYIDLKNMLASIVSERVLSEKSSSDFRKNKIKAKFLFEKNIIDYLCEIENKMIHLQCYQIERGGQVNLGGDNLLLDYFIKELVECDKKFEKYLSFQEV